MLPVGACLRPKPCWEVRTNQSSACGVAVLFESCTVRLRRGLVDDATKKPLTKVRGSCFGGRYRTRTCDLLHVKQMLYQLS